jgi:hypothetical protein
MLIPPLPYETPQFRARKEQELQKEFTAPVPILYIVILVIFVLFVLAAYGVHLF